MTVTEIIEVVVAVAMIAGGVFIYRRGDSQGGVLVFAIAVIILIHGLGLMEYRPSAAELGR
ncbi:hypothetical protein LZ519_06995 [Sphingomonas sp. RG327]|uniref:Uncharacterized protein n=1 Tax=Sphingomonas anseongensis TaxID=2908207 RepID=A0ABT0RFM0_9SPHN|nr:hypothetical protein [Sphingomonas anseongensis]MCL6679062.1 hypothetical protein [Sphingomonas anseongensis]